METRLFQNEPILDFSDSTNRERLQGALDRLEFTTSQNPILVAPLVGGQAITAGERKPTLDPSAPDKVLGEVYYADEALLDRVYSELNSFRQSWHHTTPSQRAEIIFNVGNALQSQRFELTALIVREVGKPWAEADADVVEAIDFCRYYACEMDRRATPVKTQTVIGENNFYSYCPRGIAVVIAPWNFPLAILTGMTTAALVTGNVVIIKPAEQSSLVAGEFCRILLEAGVPAGAFALLPGDGETIGRALVRHTETDLICFTGSKSVGLEILRSAAETQQGQRGVKRVIAEMGGKNAIVVDADADLDDALVGILHSAFGYAGQKCSACSRLIVVGDAYEPLLDRLKHAVQDLVVGPAADPGVFYGPVIDHDAHSRLKERLDQESARRTVLAEGRVPNSNGYFVPPVIFRDIPADAQLWRDELFGPVLACARAESFEAAIMAANDSEYALTGGVYSRSPRHIEYATIHFEVGNLYINRTCTGAIVERQPFGGSKMSGVGSKAGGPDYLLQFMEPRTITENTMRKGITPEFT